MAFRSLHHLSNLTTTQLDICPISGLPLVEMMRWSAEVREDQALLGLCKASRTNLETLHIRDMPPGKPVATRGIPPGHVSSNHS